MAYNQAVEDFKEAEYPMLKGHVYLDHGGSTLYAKSLIEKFSQNMLTNLYGNPHSASAPAELSGNAVDQVRLQALRFFGADPLHFDLIFTANATAAIKIVMEAFKDLSSSTSAGTFRYGYHKDAHTSLVGVREATNDHWCFKNDAEIESWLDGTSGNLQSTPQSAGGNDQPCLIAYPGQSNLSGRRLPLSWCERLRDSSRLEHQNAYSLLDAAALAVTCSLEKVFRDPYRAPDFTCVSFYKIFGFPDLGALIVRKKSGHILTWRKYFGGGTVNMLTVLDDAWHYTKHDSIHEALEDGTLPFHNIVALGIAIDVHRQLYGDMDRISRHTLYLGHKLFRGLKAMRHDNGTPLCIVYNEPNNNYDNAETQGATIAFNIRRADGSIIPYAEVDHLANLHKIYVRSGGLCNAGGIASYLQLAPWQMKRAWSAGHRCGGVPDLNVINGKPTGVVRASLGAMNTKADVNALLVFLREAFGTTIPKSRPLIPIFEDANYDRLSFEGPPQDSWTEHVKSISAVVPLSLVSRGRIGSNPNLRKSTLPPTPRHTPPSIPKLSVSLMNLQEKATAGSHVEEWSGTKGGAWRAASSTETSPTDAVSSSSPFKYSSIVNDEMKQERMWPGEGLHDIWNGVIASQEDHEERKRTGAMFFWKKGKSHT